MSAEALDEAPESLRDMVEPGRTALVVVDVQVDFAAPDGAMAATDCDVSASERAIDRIETLIAAARQAHAKLVFIRVVTEPESDLPNLKRFYARKGYPPDAVALCRAGTRGADYYRVAPEPGDIETQKPLFSAFAGASDFDARLHAAGVETLVFTGLTTECCVDSTLRDAFHRGYDCFLVEDACAAYRPSLHTGAVEALAENYALVIQTHDLLAAWA